MAHALEGLQYAWRRSECMAAALQGCRAPQTHTASAFYTLLASFPSCVINQIITGQINTHANFIEDTKTGVASSCMGNHVSVHNVLDAFAEFHHSAWMQLQLGPLGHRLGVDLHLALCRDTPQGAEIPALERRQAVGERKQWKGNSSPESTSVRNKTEGESSGLDEPSASNSTCRPPWSEIVKSTVSVLRAA